MATRTRTHPPFVKVYFSERDQNLEEEIELLARESGMSASMIGAMAIRLGLPMVKKNLEGLIIEPKKTN